MTLSFKTAWKFVYKLIKFLEVYKNNVSRARISKFINSDCILLISIEGTFVQRKIDELNNKWFSTHCYLKHYSSDRKSLGLTSLNKIEKNELVAVYSTKQISPQDHFIRPSQTPTCYLDGNDVYTIDNVEPNTELTLKF